MSCGDETDGALLRRALSFFRGWRWSVVSLLLELQDDCVLETGEL